MKTFQQFQEETPKGFPSIEKSLKKTAEGASKVINPADIKNFVINTVKNKALEKIGAKDENEAISKVSDIVTNKVEKMGTELPKVIDQFSDKMPEIQKTTTKFLKGLKTGDLPGMKKPKK